MKGVTSFDSRAFWCKLPSWIRESLFLLLWNHPKSVMHVRRILWSVRLIIFIQYVYPSTPSHWLTCSRKRSLCLGSNPWTCVKTSISSMMVPHLNSVVFYCKTTMWACLSGTTCSHVCSRTSSCFGACYRSSSPENPATSSRQFVLQTSVFLPRLDESGISWHQPDLNLRQIWWFGTFPKNYNIGPSETGKVDVVANTPSRKTCYYNILIEEAGHLPIGIS